MLGIFKHKKTGNLYIVDQLVKVKIPLIGWVSFTAYRGYTKQSYVTYIRLTYLFNKAFVKAIKEDFPE